MSAALTSRSPVAVDAVTSAAAATASSDGAVTIVGTVASLR